MAFLQAAANTGSLPTEHQVANSCKFERSSNEAIETTNAAVGNKKTWTFSAWLKRTELGKDYHCIFGAGYTNIHFMDNDRLRAVFYDGSNSYYADTFAMFRDTSAWYHIVVSCDTTHGTRIQAVRMYINGVRVSTDGTGFSNSTFNNMPQNTDTGLGYAGSDGSERYLRLGRFFSGEEGFSGYMAEVHYVNGTVRAADEFGEFDENGIWIPKRYLGGYGTQGFRYEFKTASALGTDSSPEGHNANSYSNIAAADQSTDTPTNNFCTLMPPQYSITGTATVVSEGGTQMKGGSTAHQNAFGSIGVRKGKWYFESNVSNLAGVASYNFMFGVIAADKTTAISNGTANYIGQIANTWGFTSNNRGTTGGTENSNFPSETATSGTTEVMGIALDMDNGKIWVHKAGTYATNDASVTGNPATGAAPQYDNLLTSTSEHILVGGGVYTFTTAAQRNMNFGNPMNANFTGVGTHSDANGYGSFAYAPPSGYYAICTKNLAEFG
jgi:hypothetical protein